MSGPSSAERAEAIRDRYRQVFGSVPHGIEQRIAVAGATGRLGAVEMIEGLRRALLAESPLEASVQQLVHFGQLIALGRGGPARLHARGALRAGATLADLVGVAETSLVTAGMPAYATAIEIVAELLSAPEGWAAEDARGEGSLDRESDRCERLDPSDHAQSPADHAPRTT